MSFLDSLARLIGHKSPQPLPPKRPDPEFMGEALVYNFLFERFRLKDDDFSRLTADLPSELKEPAKLWIVTYGTWLFRLALREKYGNEFLDGALLAGSERDGLGYEVAISQPGHPLSIADYENGRRLFGHLRVKSQRLDH